MKAYVALGSNLGDRFANLESAAQKLKKNIIRASPLFQTPPLLLPKSPEHWRLPYANAVLEIEWPSTSSDLLDYLKKIEQDLGRKESSRWAPRLIDLDIISFGSESLSTEKLTIPHQEVWNRDFVLAPLVHLQSSLRLPGQTKTVLQRYREIKGQLPLWMDILNLTPDSFSDGGELLSHQHLYQKMQIDLAAHIQYLDLGAESTRPQATLISPQKEWSRLETTFLFLSETNKNKIFRPRISVDTHRAATAQLALRAGAHTINDVGGLRDPEMISVLKNSDCEYILMHSLSVPADSKNHLPEAEDVTEQVMQFAEKKISYLEQNGVSLDRIIFDPGIGFGKTAQQSFSLLKSMDKIKQLPVRILIGHSRKSFLNIWSEQPAADRDPESLGISLQLAQQGADILRVHNAPSHKRAFQTFQELKS